MILRWVQRVKQDCVHKRLAAGHLQKLISACRKLLADLKIRTIDVAALWSANLIHQRELETAVTITGGAEG